MCCVVFVGCDFTINKSKIYFCMYVPMGMSNIKTVKAGQVHINRHRNLKIKLYNCNGVCVGCDPTIDHIKIYLHVFSNGDV